MRLAWVVVLAACSGSSSSGADAPAGTGWHIASTDFDQPLTGICGGGGDVFLIGYQTTAYHTTDGVAFAAVATNPGSGAARRPTSTRPGSPARWCTAAIAARAAGEAR